MMRKRKRILWAGLALVLFMMTILQPAERVFADTNTEKAQEAQADESEAETETETETKEAKEKIEENTSGGTFTFETDRVLEGIYTEEYVYFSVPEYWNIESAEAKLRIELSPLLLDVPASLTFSLNGVPVYSVDLDYAAGSQQTIEVAIPVEDLNVGYNNFSVTGYARIYDEDGCLDDVSEANWVAIKADSYIAVDYDLKEAAYQISEYPYPLISTANESGENVAVVVPDQASAAELTAAAWIRSGLAQEVKNKDMIKMQYLSAYEGQNAVVVASYENLSDSMKKTVKQAEIEEDDLKDAAAICVEKTQEGNCLILVTSKSEECLSEAAQYLLDDTRTSQDDTSFVLVTKDSSKMLKDAIEEKKAGNYTISELTNGADGLHFTGAFRREQSVYLPYASGYVLGTSGTMDLNFRYSKNLDFTRSLLTVYINDVPVASKKLEKDKAEGDTFSFTLPDDMAGEQITNICFAFDLEIPDMYCTYRTDDMPWAFITGDSSMYLPIGSGSSLSFDVKPFPFVKAGYCKDMLFVVPDQMSQEELNLFGEVLSLYGSAMEPYGNLQVVTSSDFKKSDAKKSHVILLGTYDDQPLLDDVNEKLPFGYDTKAGQFIGNEQLALSEQYAKTIAAMQLIPSVYNSDRVMLVVSAGNQEAIANLSGFLSDIKNRAKIVEDTVIVDKNQEIRTFEFQSANGSMEKPSLRERLAEKKESLVFSLVSTAAMLLLLLASILILLRARAVNKDKK